MQDKKYKSSLSLKQFETIRKRIQKFIYQTFNKQPQNHFERVIFICGNTGKGKSTLFQLFKGVNLISVNRNFDDIRIEEKSSSQRLIGHKLQSETKIPNMYYIQSLKILLIDCPGLLDTNGFIDDFSNKVFVMKVFQKVKQARFLLCLSESDLIHPKIHDLEKSIQGFFKYFNLEKANIKKVIQHTSVIITMINISPQRDNDFYYRKCQDNAQKKIQYFNNHSKPLNSAFLSQIFTQRRYYFFQKPQRENIQIRDSGILNNQNRFPFWRLNVKTDIDFRMQIIQDTLSKTSNQATTQAMYENILQQLTQMFKIVSASIKEIITKMNQKISTGDLKFKEQIKKFVEIYDNFQSKNNPQTRIEFSKVQQDHIPDEILQFKQIQFLERIDFCSLKYDKQKMVRQKVFEFINFLKYYFYKGQQNKYIQNFGYIMYRNFEDLSLVDNIFVTKMPKNVSQFYPQLYVNFKLFSQQQQFVKNFSINEQYNEKKGILTINALKKIKDNFLLEMQKEKNIKGGKISINNALQNLSSAKGNQTADLKNLINKIENLSQYLRRMQEQLTKYQKLKSNQMEILRKKKEKTKIQNRNQNRQLPYNSYFKPLQNISNPQKMFENKKKLNIVQNDQNAFKNEQEQIKLLDMQITKLKEQIEKKKKQFEKMKEDKENKQDYFEIKARIYYEMKNNQNLKKDRQLQVFKNQDKQSSTLIFYYNKITISIAQIYILMKKYSDSYLYLSQQEDKIFITKRIKSQDERLKSQYCQIYDLLGNLCRNNISKPLLAIQYYKVIKSDYFVKQIYKFEIEACTKIQDKINILKDYSQFLQQVGQIQQAKNSLQHLRSITCDIAEKMKINEKIEKLLNNKDAIMKKYLQQLHNLFRQRNEAKINALTQKKI